MATLTSLLVVFCVSCVAAEGTSKQPDMQNVCTDANELSFLRNERLLNLHQKSATLSATHHDTGSTYNYYIGVCTNPNTDLYSDEKCMVIQAEHFQNGSTGAVRCLGRMDSAQLTDTLSLGWTELTYGNGDRYGTHCGQSARVSRIFFFCDTSAGEGTPQFIEENNDDNYCYYLFNWPTSNICPVPTIPIDPGWIVIIILVVLVLLWGVAMVIGIIIQRLVLGAKGWDQIPFLRWYQLFGDLEVDGCNLVCRCNRGREKMIPMTTIGKQPLADPEEPESESESETEHKDEDLIPM